MDRGACWLQSMGSQRVGHDWATSRSHSRNSKIRDFLVAQMVKCLSTVRETWVQALGWEDPLQKEMAIQSSTIAWKIPWTEDPGRLQSMGSQRVGHDWVTSLHFTNSKIRIVIYTVVFLVIVMPHPYETMKDLGKEASLSDQIYKKWWRRHQGIII